MILSLIAEATECDFKYELERLITERYVLCDEYYRLDDELKSVEALRRGAEKIMRDEPEITAPTRTRGMEI